MPDKCASCGAQAVIEDDSDGGSNQRICIECGTVATGARVKSFEELVHGILKKRMHLSQVSEVEGTIEDINEEVCESCGDTLPAHISASQNLKLCQECLELEEDGALSGEQEESMKILPQGLVETAKIDATSSKFCRSCGGTNLSYESIGVDERLVCRDCGTVVGGEVLTSDEYDSTTRTFGNHITTLPVFARHKKKLRGLTAGQEQISYLQNKFCFPEDVKSEAEEMFTRVFYEPHVLHMHLKTKTVLAVACVFIACRMHDVPVCMNHFSPYVHRFMTFIKCTKIVLKSQKITLPHLNFSCQVGHFLLNHGFGSNVIAKVKDILFLCRRAWLTQGRSREVLIILAAYYAYRSIKEVAGVMSLRQFMKQFGFPHKVSVSLQAEIRDIFLKLASSIPWVSKRSVTATTVHKYIDDILKYQNSLFQLAFKSEDVSASTQNAKGADPSLVSKLEGGGKVKSWRVPRQKHETFEKDDLLPSSMKKRRWECPEEEVEEKVSVNYDLDNPDVRPSEFDEEEISSYILSPEEEARVKIPKLKFFTG